MKILQLTVHYAPNIGGVETHLVDLVSELVKKKCAVFVLAYRPLVAKAPWKMVEKTKYKTIFRIPWIPGFFYTFSKSPILSFFYLIPGLFILTPLVLLFFRPSVIHAHGIIAGFVGVFWGNIFRKKVVVSTHSLYHFPRQGMYVRFARWMFTHAAQTLCLSRQSVDEIYALGVPRKNISQFTYWINTDIFTPARTKESRQQLGWEDRFVVLFVGRLVPEKGIRELLQAVPLVQNPCLFVFIGDGPLADEIEKSQKEQNGKIQFIDKLENTLLPLYYAHADVVIVPSVHEEGFGRVILESLACGTPVIGANRGAIPDALDSTVGTLITVTPKYIAECLTDLQQDKKKLEKMATHARAFALKRYSTKNAEKIFKEYETS